jgi:hypothetical protein
MRHHWGVRRTLQPEADGQRRWDRAYQVLLNGASQEAKPLDPVIARRPPQREVHHESGNLCSRVDPTASAGTNH